MQPSARKKSHREIRRSSAPCSESNSQRRADRTRSMSGHNYTDAGEGASVCEFAPLRGCFRSSLERQRTKTNGTVKRTEPMDGVYPRPPELDWIAGCQVGKKDPAECRGQCHISLKAKLPRISQKTIFEENDSKDPPTHSNTQRLQLVPHEQQHQCRRRPRVDVLKLTSAPVLRHAYDSGQ